MVLTSLALFALFAAGIYGLRTPKAVSSYYATFHDTLGLDKGADVRFGGAKAGRVAAVRLDPEDRTRVRVEFDVAAGTPINTTSICYVSQTTLTAAKHLEVSTGEPAAEVLPNGSEVPSQQRDLFGTANQVSGKMAELLDGLKRLIGADPAANKNGHPIAIPEVLHNVDGAISDMRGLMSDNREKISATIARLEEIEQGAKGLMEQLNTVIAENRGDIRGSVEGARGAVETAKSAAARTDAILRQVQAVAGRLDAIANSLESTMRNADAMSAEARGALEENRPELERLVRDLREAAFNAKEFTRGVSTNPQSLIRGVEPAGRATE